MIDQSNRAGKSYMNGNEQTSLSILSSISPPIVSNRCKRQTKSRESPTNKKTLYQRPNPVDIPILPERLAFSYLAKGKSVS